MRFVTVRELRSQSADIWRSLTEEPEMVITSNGRPVAILSAVSSEGLEESLAALRRARASAAVETMQSRSVAAGETSPGPGGNSGGNRRRPQRPTPMKIVLDTNVLVSGLLNPYGPPGQIVVLVAAGELVLCFDPRILAEYRDVLLRPKFEFPQRHVEALLEQIRTVGTSATAIPLPAPLPDRDDEPFLEVAIAASADYLVTGNPRHYPPRRLGGINVVTPAKFLVIYREKRKVES
jgi:uncharacterized protein